MFLWEMIAYRLRLEGWSVSHVPSGVGADRAYEVRVQRPGLALGASGPTLTEAYAAAAREARALGLAPRRSATLVGSTPGR